MQLCNDRPSITPTPDNIHMANLLRGSHASWERLYQRYRPALLRFCSNYTPDPQTAEAWTHDTFLQLKVKAGTFHPEAELKPWLYKIARNICLQDLRKKSEVSWSDSVAARNALTLTDRNQSPASRLVTTELRGRMKDLLAELSEEERTVVLLKIVEGLTRQEIAVTMETPEATVKSRLHRAMKILRNKIERES
jgi:RNA polymerase sigma-70 factor (ECF subfamily)